ncbi:MAG: 16S rRNA (guanine(966)-N(2))-methyltransferase RsmD [Coriobacteriia bacterium]|nr:16S rRNA (guanine(966)-N(2))-methyltransferase RsmD [Coriobacteriia bacterium]
MRIVSGEYRGRRLSAPKGDETRPTTDRVREALFSSLVSYAGANLGGGRALDAFAGSGALGFEALSRGVEHVTFLERERPALGVLRANADTLGAARSVIIVSGDTSYLAERGAIPGGPFSLLLLDPPYRLDAGEVGQLVATLVARDLLEEDALIVYEHSSVSEAVWPADVTALASKRYGSTTVDIARYERGAGST